jgi:peptidyl-prolyl cis-trans isomerase D
VKQAVADAMRSDAAQKALAAKADEIVAKLNAGRPIEDVAKEVGVQTQRANEVKREARPDFNTNVIVRFFDVAPRNAGSVVLDNGRLVFFVRARRLVFDPNSIEAGRSPSN